MKGSLKLPFIFLKVPMNKPDHSIWIKPLACSLGIVLILSAISSNVIGALVEVVLSVIPVPYIEAGIPAITLCLVFCLFYVFVKVMFDPIEIVMKRNPKLLMDAALLKCKPYGGINFIRTVYSVILIGLSLVVIVGSHVFTNYNDLVQLTIVASYFFTAFAFFLVLASNKIKKYEDKKFLEQLTS